MLPTDYKITKQRTVSVVYVHVFTTLFRASYGTERWARENAKGNTRRPNVHLYGKAFHLLALNRKYIKIYFARGPLHRKLGFCWKFACLLRLAFTALGNTHCWNFYTCVL